MNYKVALQNEGFKKVQFLYNKGNSEYYKLITNDGEPEEMAKIENNTLFLLVDGKWENEGSIYPEIDPYEINQGDFVNFGGFGNFYVTNTNAGETGDKFWVTDSEENRNNENARGLFLHHCSAKSIIEKYNYIN